MTNSWTNLDPAETTGEFLCNSDISDLTKKPTYREASYDGSVARADLWSIIDPEDPEELDVSPDVENCPQQFPHPCLCAVGALVDTARVVFHTQEHQAVLPGPATTQCNGGVASKQENILI